MAKLLLLFVICVGLLPVAVQAQENTEFIPGEVWKDTDGNPINAHGGGLLYHNGTYYWYGEYKKGKTVLPEWATWECYRTDVTGVGCYSSKDLLNWKFEGIVLPAVKNDPDHDLHPSKVLERPKVVYNKKTGKFVMWHMWKVPITARLVPELLFPILLSGHLFIREVSALTMR